MKEFFEALNEILVMLGCITLALLLFAATLMAVDANNACSSFSNDDVQWECHKG